MYAGTAWYECAFVLSDAIAGGARSGRPSGLPRRLGGGRAAFIDFLTRPCPNESHATRMVRLRAESDLMGIPLPLELCPTEPSSMRPNGLVIPRRLPRHQDPDELISLAAV